MNDFKLRMDYRQLNQRVGAFHVVILFPIVEQLRQQPRLGRNIGSILKRCLVRADPVLHGTKTSAPFVTATYAVQQNGMQPEQKLRLNGRVRSSRSASRKALR